MGWHADDEKELGGQPNIASLSLGAARDIHFKSKHGEREMLKLNLPSGSLLIMDGETQRYWLHHIPKRAKCTTPRINLTFRNIATR
jgi:alkylated DNA repair dioxygenase AlkB